MLTRFLMIATATMATALVSSGCSLKQKDAASGSSARVSLAIDSDGPRATSNLTSNLMMNVTSGQMTPSEWTPSSLSDFDCFMINVTGPSILSRFSDASIETPAGEGCTYPGVMSQVVPNQPGTQLIDLNVPIGDQRLFQVIGLKLRDGVTQCPIDPPFSKFSESVFRGSRELGRTRVDVKDDIVLDISVKEVGQWIEPICGAKDLPIQSSSSASSTSSLSSVSSSVQSSASMSSESSASSSEPPALMIGGVNFSAGMTVTNIGNHYQLNVGGSGLNFTLMAIGGSNNSAFYQIQNNNGVCSVSLDTSSGYIAVSTLYVSTVCMFEVYDAYSKSVAYMTINVGPTNGVTSNGISYQNVHTPSTMHYLTYSSSGSIMVKMSAELLSVDASLNLDTPAKLFLGGTQIGNPDFRLIRDGVLVSDITNTASTRIYSMFSVPASTANGSHLELMVQKAGSGNFAYIPLPAINIATVSQTSLAYTLAQKSGTSTMILTFQNNTSSSISVLPLRPDDAIVNGSGQLILSHVATNSCPLGEESSLPLSAGSYCQIEIDSVSGADLSGIVQFSVDRSFGYVEALQVPVTVPAPLIPVLGINFTISIPTQNTPGYLDINLDITNQGQANYDPSGFQIIRSGLFSDYEAGYENYANASLASSNCNTTLSTGRTCTQTIRIQNSHIPASSLVENHRNVGFYFKFGPNDRAQYTFTNQWNP